MIRDPVLWISVALLVVGVMLVVLGVDHMMLALALGTLLGRLTTY